MFPQRLNRSISLSASLLAGLWLAASPTAQAETQVFLRFPGIEGSSQLVGYQGQIALESFSFSVGRACRGGDPSSGDLFCSTPQWRPLTLVKALDRSDAALTLRAVTGVRSDICISVVSTGNNPGSPVARVEEFRIGKALVSDVGLAVTANGELRRTVTLAYEAFAVTPFSVSDQTGSEVVGARTGWSFRNNRQVNDADLGAIANSAACTSPSP
jgi:type VI protein secretion system component Hcp